MGPLADVNTVQNILEIAKGRNREWYDNHFDCVSLGLVQKFYQAAFGTVTHEKTKKLTVITIVMNDEWNDLVRDTSQLQDMYIGKSSDPDAKPNLRDKAAEALVFPAPQREPVALFFAPKNGMGTSDIYYAGHWKVVDGKLLTPLRDVKGQPRQCLAKLKFAGIDQALVDAINHD